MSNSFIRKVGQEPFEIVQQQVVTDIKRGKLVAEDEISLDGQSWIRLDQHRQLYVLFDEPESVPEEPGNFFHKLWHGKNPLWKSFWFFAVLLPLGVNFLFLMVFVLDLMGALQNEMINAEQMSDAEVAKMLSEKIPALAEKIKPYFTGFAVMMLTLSGYAFFVNVGLWRSASQYPGAGIWRILAKVWVVLVLVSLPFNVIVLSGGLASGFESQFRELDNAMQAFREEMKYNEMTYSE